MDALKERDADENPTCSRRRGPTQVRRWCGSRRSNCFTLNNIAAGALDDTQPLMDFACTGDASGVVDDRLVIRSCDFGRALGGAVRIRSYIGIELDHVTVGNVYAQQGKSLARAPINIGTYGSSGTPSRGVEIVSYFREGNGPNGSVYDIQLSPDTSQVTVRTPATTDPAAPVSADLRVGILRVGDAPGIGTSHGQQAARENDKGDPRGIEAQLRLARSDG